MSTQKLYREFSLGALSFKNISAVYVLLGFVILFSVWIPDLFLTPVTLRTLLYQQAITAVIAVGLVMPLAAGVYDFSVGSMVGLSSAVFAWCHVILGIDTLSAVAITFAVGLSFGALNGILVTRFRIDSVIATLAMSSVLMGVGTWITGEQQIYGLSSEFLSFTGVGIFGLAWPVYYLLILGFIVWVVLEFTSAGRYIYATGGNREAARLSGISTGKVVLWAMVASAAVATFAGLLATSRNALGDFHLGPSYLLPAFAAAFLGATQLRDGKPNVWGTVIAAYTLATGVKGLQLAGAPIWLPDVFNGLALIIAVGIAMSRKAPGAR